MKLQVSIELQLQDGSHKSDVLSELMPATKKFEKLFNHPVSAELTQVVFPDNIIAEPHSVIQVEGIQINHRTQTVLVDGNEIAVTPIEFKLLYLLMERRGQVQSRHTLLSDVWKINPGNNTRTVDVHVKRLRDKLGNSRHLIQAVSGVGYVIK